MESIVKKIEKKIIGPQQLASSLGKFMVNSSDRLNVSADIFSELGTRALGIINDHNTIAEQLSTNPEFKTLLKREEQLRGASKLGHIICIDGRLMAIHFGRTVDIWEEPASGFRVELRKDQGLIIGTDGLAQVGPKIASPDLVEALKIEASQGSDLLEIIYAHTSLTTPHICGYMNGKREKGKKEIKGYEKYANLDDEELLQENLKEIESDQIPAFTNTYNTLRHDNNHEVLKKIAISAVFDTDTYGIILNYGDHELSTTKMLEGALKKDIEEHLSKDIGHFGSLRNEFIKPSQFYKYYEKVVKLTEKLMESNEIGFQSFVREYINTHYKELTLNQQQALFFTIARRTAFQYLTGLSSIPETGPDHPFADHEEGYATVATSGKAVIGRYDVINQSFGITASDMGAAVHQVRDVALPLLDKNDPKGKEAHIIFVATPIDENTTFAGDIVKNASLFKKICQIKEVRERIKKGKLLVVPVLVDSDTEKIIGIPDQSIYF